MAGIARAAAVSVEDIALVNARSELLGPCYRDQPSQCTSVLIAASRSATGRPVVAQTWDWFPVTAPLLLLLRAKPRDGPAFLALTEAGQLGKVGVNEQGVALAINYLPCPSSEREVARGGVPMSVVTQTILDSPSIAAARERIDRLPRDGALNLVLADASSVRMIESTPERLVDVRIERGLATHANDFEAIGRLPERAPWRSARLRELLEPHRTVDRDLIVKSLRDHKLRAGVICAHEVAGGSTSVAASLAALVLEPAGAGDDPSPAAWVLGGPPCRHEPVRVRLPV